jgi:hypothetical protein
MSEWLVPACDGAVRAAVQAIRFKYDKGRFRSPKRSAGGAQSKRRNISTRATCFGRWKRHSERSHV